MQFVILHILQVLTHYQTRVQKDTYMCKETILARWPYFKSIDILQFLTGRGIAYTCHELGVTGYCSDVFCKNFVSYVPNRVWKCAKRGRTEYYSPTGVS